ncbi:hypothetical protein B0H13DRAFT_1853619 [Mycena leptocephala]|nr:hypothetical protein B0H13DRAFT_1853619 [Mycena leptocephala]
MTIVEEIGEMKSCQLRICWTSASVLADIKQASSKFIQKIVTNTGEMPVKDIKCHSKRYQMLPEEILNVGQRFQLLGTVSTVSGLRLSFSIQGGSDILHCDMSRVSLAVVWLLDPKVDLTSQRILGVCTLPGSDPIQYITNWDILKISTAGGHCNDASTKFSPELSCPPLRAHSPPFVDPSIDEHPVRFLDFKCGYILGIIFSSDSVKYPKASQGIAQLVRTIITDNSANNNATVQLVIGSHPSFSPSRWTSELRCVAHLYNLQAQTNGKQELMFEPSASTSAEAF